MVLRFGVNLWLKSHGARMPANIYREIAFKIYGAFQYPYGTQNGCPAELFRHLKIFTLARSTTCMSPTYPASTCIWDAEINSAGHRGFFKAISLPVIQINFVFLIICLYLQQLIYSFTIQKWKVLNYIICISIIATIWRQDNVCFCAKSPIPFIIAS